MQGRGVSTGTASCSRTTWVEGNAVAVGTWTSRGDSGWLPWVAVIDLDMGAIASSARGVGWELPTGDGRGNLVVAEQHCFGYKFECMGSPAKVVVVDPADSGPALRSRGRGHDRRYGLGAGLAAGHPGRWADGDVGPERWDVQCPRQRHPQCGLAGVGAVSGSSDLAALDGVPDAFWGAGHVYVGDAEGGQGVDDGVLDGGGCGYSAALGHSFGAEGVALGGGFDEVGLYFGDIAGRGDEVVGQADGERGWRRRRSASPRTARRRCPAPPRPAPGPTPASR